MGRLHVAEGIVVERRPGWDGVRALLVRCRGVTRRALAYVPPLPEPRPGDRVVLNTAAVDLGLGTGGWDFVLWVAASSGTEEKTRGHMMKLRYTPWQLPVLAAEEEGSPWRPALETARDLDGMPGVVLALHSQLPAAAAGLRLLLGPRAPIVFIMTDGAALPLAFSRTAASLKGAGLLDGTVTTGHAFGGDLESMTLFSGLLAARHGLGAAAAIVGPGPGTAGTGTTFGTPAVEAGQHADAVGMLGGYAVAAPRISFADDRGRHRGVSHHTLTAFGTVAQRRCTVVVPSLPAMQRRRVLAQLAEAGIRRRHDVVEDGRGEEALALLGRLDIPLRSMGRDEKEEKALFLAAAAAGVVAGEKAKGKRT